MELMNESEHKSLHEINLAAFWRVTWVNIVAGRRQLVPAGTNYPNPNEWFDRGADGRIIIKCVV